MFYSFIETKIYCKNSIWRFIKIRKELKKKKTI